MKTIRFLFLIFLISSLLISFSYAKTKVKDYDFGVGIGIPYGGIGGNIEAGKDYAFTAGLGVMPFTDATAKNTQIGWSTGIRAYLNELQPGVRLRASVLWGTVAYAEKVITNNLGNTSREYELLTGFAPSIGLRGENWDFDLSFPLGYNVPGNETEQGGKIKFSFGFRF